MSFCLSQYGFQNFWALLRNCVAFLLSNTFLRVGKGREGGLLMCGQSSVGADGSAVCKLRGWLGHRLILASFLNGKWSKWYSLWDPQRKDSYTWRAPICVCYAKVMKQQKCNLAVKTLTSESSLPEMTFTGPGLHLGRAQTTCFQAPWAWPQLFWYWDSRCVFLMFPLGLRRPGRHHLDGGALTGLFCALYSHPFRLLPALHHTRVHQATWHSCLAPYPKATFTPGNPNY